MPSLHTYYPFDYPSRRSCPERAEDIGVFTNNWINDVLPYRGNSAYRVHEAMYRGGGNCYAQALGAMALLSHWNITNGLVLDQYHAKVVMVHQDEIWFIDPADETFTPQGEARIKRRDETGSLANLYEDSVENVLQGGENRYYYMQALADPRQSWSDMPVTDVPRDAIHLSPHIIARHTTAEDILHAIGDLKRFQATDLQLYAERYNDLAPFVPPMIALDSPLIAPPVTARV